MKTNCIFLICILFLFFLSPSAQSQAVKNLVPYIWNFEYRDGKQDDFTRDLTQDFETGLLNQRCIKTILNRRNSSRILQHKKNENEVLHLDNISESSIEAMKNRNANAILFGEVYDDKNAGAIKITVSLQTFNYVIPCQKTTYIEYKYRNNPDKRIEEMKKMAAGLCRCLGSKIDSDTTDNIDIIKRLLSKADELYSQGDYIGEQHKNAYDIYKEVLAYDSTNRHALDRIEKISDIIENQQKERLDSINKNLKAATENFLIEIKKDPPEKNNVLKRLSLIIRHLEQYKNEYEKSDGFSGLIKELEKKILQYNKLKKTWESK